MKRREEMNLLERLYFVEVVKGVMQTSSDLFKHVALYLLSVVIKFAVYSLLKIKHIISYSLSLVGMKSQGKLWAIYDVPLNFLENSIKRLGKPWATFEYPDESRPYAERYRGRHRLTLDPQGSVKCTACFLCATACPAKCIYIEAAEHDDEKIEKFPNRYEIDTLLCIYCGYCVEACPVDAIRMDTGIHPHIYPPDPRAFIEDKETLMLRSRILEDQGSEALFADHMKRMREIEGSRKDVGEY